MLHAKEISFEGLNGEMISVESNLPKEFGILA
jgi:hypothetical protein